ncbi:hypothetical protein [Flexivirga caeni]|nr:hypothetical protein [Flexivirga caeni]
MNHPTGGAAPIRKRRRIYFFLVAWIAVWVVLVPLGSLGLWQWNRMPAGAHVYTATVVNSTPHLATTWTGSGHSRTRHTRTSYWLTVRNPEGGGTTTFDSGTPRDSVRVYRNHGQWMETNSFPAWAAALVAALSLVIGLIGTVIAVHQLRRRALR